MNTGLLELDDYEATNLRAALLTLRKLGLDTGDWLGQILFRIPASEMDPNIPVDKQVEDVRAALRYRPC